MSWALSEGAKTLRRVIYEQLLDAGHGAGIGVLQEQTGFAPAELATAVDELERTLMVMCAPGSHDIAKCPPWSNIPTRHAVGLDVEPSAHWS